MTSIKSVDVPLTRPKAIYEGAIESQSILADAVHLIGFGFDGTACFRKGACEGPDALRAVSADIESYSPYLDRDLEETRFIDLGNLDVGGPATPAETAWRKGVDDFTTLFKDADLGKSGVKVLMLGGEHSVSYAPIKAYLEAFPNLCLIHLDAHADMRDGYQGYHYSHASVIRRVLDHFGPGHDLIQYGIRSGTAEEYRWMRENGTLWNDRESFLETVRNISDERPVYLTLDLDYFDPAYLPGTGTPEPGGEDFHSFVSLCKILQHKNFVGADVVELSPPIDATGNSDVLATKVVRELILCLTPSQ